MNFFQTDNFFCYISQKICFFFVIIVVFCKKNWKNKVFSVLLQNYVNKQQL